MYILSGSIYGLLSIILGAFGAYALKKIISLEKVQSFEVGVRYMMYHALALLILGYILDFTNGIEKNAVRFIIIGTFLFSFSIYLLAFSEKISIPTKILGPITPLGGLFMISGWALLVYYFSKFISDFGTLCLLI
ncbi:MAG: DUF423 domain-containing protein [Saprospiraceae bacterium]